MQRREELQLQKAILDVPHPCVASAMGHACSSHKDRPSQGEYPPPGSTLEQALQNTGAARGPEEMQLLKDARDRVRRPSTYGLTQDLSSKLFREMDLDGNGTIDRAEMESFLERSAQAPAQGRTSPLHTLNR